MKISMVVPSRGRVEGMRSLAQSIADTVRDPDNVEIIFRLDDDDTASIDFLRSSVLGLGLRIKSVVKPRDTEGLSDCFNDAYAEADGEIIGVCGDDVTFKSKYWDTVVRKTFQRIPDKIVVVYGKDLRYIHTGSARHPFVHRNWVEVLGYVCSPNFVYHADSWMNYVARDIGRLLFVPEIVTEHYCRGFDKTKRSWDETYKEMQSRAHLQQSTKLFFSPEMKKRRIEDAKKLLKFIDDFNKRKGMAS